MFSAASVKKVVLAALLLGALAGCHEGGQAVGVTRLALPSNAVETEAKPRKVVRGQLLYLPCYSHVYLLNGKAYNLSITLSLRNTSRSEKIVVQRIDYYDTSGGLVKNLSPREIEMAPLSVAEIFVHEKDTSGGSGASFLVRWVAESKVPDPYVQAVMVGSSGSLGVSFTTTPQLLEQLPSTPSSPLASPTPNL